MPAIQLAELRKETAKIASNFSNGEIVIKELTEFFEFYSNRTHRINPSAEKLKVISNYNIAQPILRQLITELNGKASQDPESALDLADRLWAQNNLEFRILAAHLMGAIPISHTKQITERLHIWGQENNEESIGEILASDSLSLLITEAKPEFLKLLDEWLKAEKIGEVILGLEALAGYLNSAKFEELPVIFRLIRPLSIQASRKLHPYILNVIRLLARRSPPETVYFLRQCLGTENSKTTIWLIRNSLKDFSEEVQESLKKVIRNPSS